MKIKYKFNNGEISEVEVSEEIGNFILESRRNEHNLNRRQRYHCISLDAFDYEDLKLSTVEQRNEETEDNRVRYAFSHLNERQQRRLFMLSQGLSEREIARREGVTLRAIQECLDGAKKKFLKNY